jgi:nucleoside-diphosphate-sugar epimerase
MTATLAGASPARPDGPPTVLVTGATGFVGRNALEPLRARGYAVHGVHRAAPAPAVDGVTWHRADLTAPGEADRVVGDVRPSHLLHLAWYAEPGRFWTAPDNLTWVAASVALIQAFAAGGGRRLVAAGTCAEYDWRHGFCSEGVTPVAPETLYGTAKHALQELLGAYAGPAGVSAAWGRIFFLFGPREHPDRLVSSVIRSLLREEAALCTHGNQIRDFLHVEDVGDAFAALLDSDAEGPVNVGSGDPVALRDLVARIADKLGRRDLVRLGARAAPAGEPPMVVADVRRLRDAVGWTPRRGLDEGLDDTIAWWREELRA